MKILVTGAAGFLGKALVKRLHDHELYCLTRKLSDDLPSGDNIRWIETNLSNGLDLSKLPDQMDAIIHLAQSNGYRNFPDEARDVFNVNVGLTQDLCEYGVKSGISSMILASTGSVYEPFDGEMTEDAPVRPTGYYGASKLSAELISEAYLGQFGVCNLRVFFLYGSGQENMLIARLIDGIKSGNSMSLPADGKGLQFVPTFVEDTADVFVKAVEEDWRGVFNVASPHVVDFAGLLETISKATGKPLKVEITDAAAPTPIIPDMTKLRSKIDVDAFHTVEAGIAKTV